MKSVLLALSVLVAASSNQPVTQEPLINSIRPVLHHLCKSESKEMSAPTLPSMRRTSPSTQTHRWGTIRTRRVNQRSLQDNFKPTKEIGRVPGLLSQVQRLQASFINNFPAYVTWPRGTIQGNRLNIGLIGPNPLGRAGRQYLKGRFYGNLIFNVEQVSPRQENLTQYQILYIEGLPDKEIKNLLKTIKKKPILTVGRHPKFLDWGGIINFRVHGKAVRFDVSLQNAKAAGIDIDARLMTYGQTL